MDFFDSSRTHMKQELLLPEDEFSSLRETAFIQMPVSVLKAWYVLARYVAESIACIDFTVQGLSQLHLQLLWPKLGRGFIGHSSKSRQPVM